MDEKLFRTLEYNKIIEILSQKAISPMGKELASDLKPSINYEEIIINQKETSESVEYILKKGSLPLGGIRDIRPSLKRVKLGGTLSILELLNVGEFLYVCKKIVKYGKGEGKQEIFERLDPLFELVQTVPKLEAEINRCIVSEVEIHDDASEKLRDIRRNIKITNSRIKDQLNSVIQSQTYKNMLQDNVITMRNGRYCVPIKNEYKSAFKGMVHDQSSTGATLFIEPMAVVELNNKLNALANDEKAEIDKILLDLSNQVGEVSEILEANLENITHLDFVFAKGQLSISFFGTEPIINRNGYINIKKGRHPLLPKDSVVPTDIYLGKEFTTLLITGPNTGGKTVSLKTLGLFTLMGQSGLHIPAVEKSELALFNNVFADIGDEQSIEQSLSTFSGHMTNIVNMLKVVTKQSLVLLDELGAGTDPTEGAALAIAIIQHLHDKKIRTAVTTHYSELKLYALSTDGVENAACEFDVDTLRPTYKLLIGVPGKSNAFAISKRLGLPDYIIDSAKTLLSQEDERFEDVITDLEISKKNVIIEQERAKEYRREAEKLKKEFETQKEKIDKQKEKIILDAKNEARFVLEEAKKESAFIIKEMHQIVSSSPNFKELEEKRQKINDKLSEVNTGISELQAAKKVLKPIIKKVEKGDKVYVHSLSQTGVVLTNPDNAGDLMLQAGIMKIKVNLSDLSIDETKEKVKPIANKYASSVKKNKSMNISPELDLRGMMVEEALILTDKYLDDACLAGLGQVSIIHGKGTGALRKAIQEHLRRHPHIKNFRLGVYGEGETGITIAEIK